MASIREYPTSSGHPTFKVMFRHNKKQRSKSFATREGAERFVTRMGLDGIDAALAYLDADPATARALTLDELAAQWFEKREQDVKAGKLTPRVLAGYRRDYDNWISSWLGRLPANRITELDVQRWIDRIQVMPRSAAKSVSDRHAILHGIYKWASNARYRVIEPIGYNPCIGTELPSHQAKPPKGLRLPELQALTATARATNEPAADLIDFIIGTGWRLGEAIALTAGQVEDDGEAVYVTMSRVWRRDVGFVDDAKSWAGLRRLRVLGDGVGVLRRRVVGLGPGDLVFTTAKGLPWQETAFRRDHWKKITVAAGLGGGYQCQQCDSRPTSQKRVESHERRTGHAVVKIEGRNPTPHWLRHSHVFICHAAGMDLAQIQRRLGHKDIQMTINTYGRLIDGMTDEVAARLDALLTTRPAAIETVKGEVLPLPDAE